MSSARQSRATLDAIEVTSTLYMSAQPPPSVPGDAPIFIVGFMATGKTTVGRILARRLGWTMVDLDDEIVRAAGMSVPEIFATRGEAAFRDEEAQAVRA